MSYLEIGTAVLASTAMPSSSLARLSIAVAALSLVVAAAEQQASAQGAASCQAEKEAFEADRTGAKLEAFAKCHEDGGRVASAWKAYKELQLLAHGAGDVELKGRAQEREKALEARLPKIRIDVRAAEMKGLVVQLDGATVDPARYGHDEIVDPGDHEIRVVRGEQVLETKRIGVLEKDRQIVSLDFEAILRAAPPLPAPVAPAPPVAPGPAPVIQPGGRPLTDLGYDETNQPPAHWAQTMGYVFLSIGLVGGAAFGALEGAALAVKGNADCSDAIEDHTYCSPKGFDEMGTARTLAEAGQWLGVTGAVFLVGGIIALVAAPSTKVDASPPRVSVVPVPLPQGAGLLVAGSLP